MADNHVTFTPEICKPKGDEPAAYEGSVTVRMPDYLERLDLQSAGTPDDEDEGDDEAPKKPKRKSTIVKLRAVAEHCEAFVVAVAIKRLDDGYEFKSFKELLQDSEAGAVAMEICTKLVAGKYQVGKPQAS